MGPTGVGKHTIVRRFLDRRAAAEEVPPDWCYVHNFQLPHKPHAVRFPAGQAQKFGQEMERLVEDLRAAIPTAFESDEYRARHHEIDAEFNDRQAKAFEEVRDRAAKKDVALIQTPSGHARPTAERLYNKRCILRARRARHLRWRCALPGSIRKKYDGGRRYSFDQKGVHFIGLVNVANIQEGGLGTLGQEQLDWLEKDVKSLSASTPIVLFAHIPLWAVYPQWGWGTDDAERALSFVKRFGSVTVLNGHIHQVMQKVEGNITFHTARGTAFPLPTPGSGPKPLPVVVDATQLKKMLGLTSVSYTETNHTLAVIDSTLG